jgi:hypothetical protein
MISFYVLLKHEIFTLNKNNNNTSAMSAVHVKRNCLKRMRQFLLLRNGFIKRMQVYV